MKKILPAVMALCIAFASNSCKKGNTGPAGPAGPSFAGAIKGFVTVYDQYGNTSSASLTNVQLTLKGARTKNADANGYFIFDSVVTGTYHITASGAGLATTLANNIGLVKDTFFQGIKLSAIPTFNLSTFDVYHNPGSEFDSVVINVAPDTRARNLIVFVNKTPDVSNIPGHYVMRMVKPVPVAPAWVTTTKVMFRIHASEFNSANIFYGEQTYFAAYSYVVNDASVYTDPATGKDVYNAVGTALIDSQMAP